MTNEEKTLNSALLEDCTNGEYFVNGKCCPTGEFYDSDTSSCTSLSAPLNNCQTVDSFENCTSCVDSSSQYISNGVCCPNNQYFDGTNCTAINTTNYPNCEQFQDICTSCSSGTLTDGCCSTNTTRLEEQCVTNITNCEVMADSI